MGPPALAGDLCARPRRMWHTAGMIVLVTGCRSGFGKLVAVEAARRGHTVYAGLRDLGTAQEQLLPEAAGLPVIPVQLDIVDAGQREAVVKQILDAHGRIDGLVNNAGIALGGFLEQVEDDELRRVFEVNVFATWALTKLVLPAMRGRRAGHVVQVSSMSGRMAFPCLGTYAASKHALEGMSESWRHELLHFGVQMHLVEPGAYATDIWTRNRSICRNANDPSSPYAPFVKHVDALFARVVDRQAGDPRDVATAIVDLLEGRRTRFRLPLGRDARLRLALKRFAPERLLEAIIHRATTPRG
jgi:NAD(P)-dependent dehydrogenase (short-subunit alcohol dehydrogenase family)